MNPLSSDSELRKFFFEQNHDCNQAKDLTDALRNDGQVEDNFKAGLSFCKALEKPNMKKPAKLKRLEMATRNCYAEFLNSVNRVSEAKQQVEIVLEMLKEDTESSKEHLFYNKISITKCRFLVQTIDERWEKIYDIYLIEMATCLRYAECLTNEGNFDDAIKQIKSVSDLVDTARTQNCKLNFDVEKCTRLIAKIELLKQTHLDNGSFKTA